MGILTARSVGQQPCAQVKEEQEAQRRVAYGGALYHVMSRGNERRPIVRADADHERRLECLERTVETYGWRLPAFGQRLRDLIDGRPEQSDVPQLRALRAGPSLAQVVAAVSADLDVDPDPWRPGRRNDDMARALPAHADSNRTRRFGLRQKKKQGQMSTIDPRSPRSPRSPTYSPGPPPMRFPVPQRGARRYCHTPSGGEWGLTPVRRQVGFSNAPSKKRLARQARSNTPVATPSGIPSPRICSKQAMTFAPSRNCLGTKTSARP